MGNANGDLVTIDTARRHMNLQSGSRQSTKTLIRATLTVQKGLDVASGHRRHLRTCFAEMQP